MLKLVLVGSATVICPMALFFGVLALFGANTVAVSGRPVTGIMGLLAAIIMAPIFVLFVSLFAWVGAYLGVRIWGHFRPLDLEYISADEEAPSSQQLPPSGDPAPPAA
ncbi:hypothetical protein [Opitutus sp. ER46]|uniref:hypothetical protein n=1 Tax=Opitutus sp. ER46 TaxID=2161864 RepID=UPI0011B267A7|nr:hypothetical protein [Opitutus sp. ER46]